MIAINEETIYIIKAYDNYSNCSILGEYYNKDTAKEEYEWLKMEHPNHYIVLVEDIIS